MSRPLEYEYISDAAYCRALEEYTDELEAVLRECREALIPYMKYVLPGILNYPAQRVAKIDEVLK